MRVVTYVNALLQSPLVLITSNRKSKRMLGVNAANRRASGYWNDIRRQRDAGGIVQKLGVLIFRYVFVTTVRLLFRFLVICTRADYSVQLLTVLSRNLPL